MHMHIEVALVISAYTLFHGFNQKYPTVQYLTAHRAFPQCTSASALWWLRTTAAWDAADTLDLALRAYAQAVVDEPTLKDFQKATAELALRYGAKGHEAHLRALARCLVAWDPWSL
jgi:hypothetical protein